MRNIFVFIGLYLVGFVKGQASPFVNLGFDEANTNTTQFTIRADPFQAFLKGVGPAEDLLPGWRVFLGTNPVTTVGYEFVSSEPGTPSSYFSLLTQRFHPQSGIEGPYLLAIENSPGDTPMLVQTGDIPLGVNFMTYRSITSGLIVNINGNNYEPSEDRSQYPFFYSLDVSRFAGQNVELKFFPLSGSATIDSIAFVVPEPKTFLLFGVGGLAWLIRWSVRRIPRPDCSTLLSKR